MKSITTSILIGIVVLAVAGGIYYFIFMSGPAIDLSAPVNPGALVPTINISVMENPIFKALKSYSSLPIVVDKIGNSLPFKEKIYLEAATSTVEF